MDISYARLKDNQEQFEKNAGNSKNMILNPLNNGTDRSRSPSPNAVRPLLHIGGNNTSNAPLANVEADDEHDDREVVNRPYPGVDDGFFTNGTNIENVKPSGKDDSGHPDVEFINPKEPEDIPTFTIVPRLGPDDNDGNPEVNPDQPDAAKPPTDIAKTNPSGLPDFPGSPGFRPWGYDFELGNGVNTLPSGETIPDLNVYQHKKTLAQGMMDLALFSANANQLRYVLETFRNHPYYYPSLTLISLSLLLQVAVGIGLVWNATYNVKDKKALCIANKINNFTIIGVFLVTIINVFISAFGVAPAPP